MSLTTWIILIGAFFILLALADLAIGSAGWRDSEGS